MRIIYKKSNSTKIMSYLNSRAFNVTSSDSILGYQAAAAEGVPSGRPAAICASSSGAPPLPDASQQGAQGGSAAQISFQPSVTYTLAPGMSPMPGKLRFYGDLNEV